LFFSVIHAVTNTPETAITATIILGLLIRNSTKFLVPQIIYNALLRGEQRNTEAAAYPLNH
ncbi:hypothetical protein ACSTD8_22490, partial [Vibrio vulnificus]|uniref:hypothetical protein n=1 Tax=Vibrio vulnificus TaxID=672 RepID=UPI003ED851E1